MKTKIVFLNLAAFLIFFSFLTFVSAEEQSGNTMTASIPGIVPGSAVDKELQAKIQQAAGEIETKCSQFKEDNQKFNECVNKYALEAAKSMQPLIAQGAANQKTTGLSNEEKVSLEQVNKIMKADSGENR
ncbi:MAG: hypothetical protein WC417_00385 [Candidatus Omnitrophota bacterium]|jgi:hypothetical protein